MASLSRYSSTGNTGHPKEPEECSWKNSNTAPQDQLTRKGNAWEEPGMFVPILCSDQWFSAFLQPHQFGTSEIWGVNSGYTEKKKSRLSLYVKKWPTISDIDAWINYRTLQITHVVLLHHYTPGYM